MTTNIDKLKENTRKVRDKAAHTAESVWRTTRDTVNAAGESAGVLIESTRKAADAVVKTTRRKIQDARIRGRELEVRVRGMAATAADRVERVSHKVKKLQEAKVRSARVKNVVTKAKRAAARNAATALDRGKTLK